ncbi:MAG: hypothetical protein BWK79_13865 [Beggiatoa sp. IS2]|nr:MAG: hypothetical protein BWK79_13865 [Beggiatoa sp. IS2]
MNVLKNLKWLGLLPVLVSLATYSVADTIATPYLKVAGDSVTDAVNTLLREAENHFEAGDNEQAAAKLERALRIDSQNAILWHNLAGVRLQQQDWERAASLAAKSNTFAVDNKRLRMRNWIVIALACQGMGDNDCMREAQKRARASAN